MYGPSNLWKTSKVAQLRSFGIFGEYISILMHACTCIHSYIHACLGIKAHNSELQGQVEAVICKTKMVKIHSHPLPSLRILRSFNIFNLWTVNLLPKFAMIHLPFSLMAPYKALLVNKQLLFSFPFQTARSLYYESPK